MGHCCKQRKLLQSKSNEESNLHILHHWSAGHKEELSFRGNCIYLTFLPTTNSPKYYASFSCFSLFLFSSCIASKTQKVWVSIEARLYWMGSVWNTFSCFHGVCLEYLLLLLQTDQLGLTGDETSEIGAQPTSRQVSLDTQHWPCSLSRKEGHVCVAAAHTEAPHTCALSQGRWQTNGTRNSRAWSPACISLPAGWLGKSWVFCEGFGPFPTWKFCFRGKINFTCSVGVSEELSHPRGPHVAWKAETNVPSLWTGQGTRNLLLLRGNRWVHCVHSLWITWYTGDVTNLLSMCQPSVWCMYGW